MHKMPLELPRCLSAAFPLQALFLQQMRAVCSLGVALGMVFWCCVSVARGGICGVAGHDLGLRPGRIFAQRLLPNEA